MRIYFQIFPVQGSKVKLGVLSPVYISRWNRKLILEGQVGFFWDNFGENGKGKMQILEELRDFMQFGICERMNYLRFFGRKRKSHYVRLNQEEDKVIISCQNTSLIIQLLN